MVLQWPAEHQGHILEMRSMLFGQRVYMSYTVDGRRSVCGLVFKKKGKERRMERLTQSSQKYAVRMTNLTFPGEIFFNA